MTDFTIRPMTSADIEAYRAWFADAKLTAQIDAPNDVWVDHIRSTAATAWSVLIGDELVAHLHTEDESAAEGTVLLVVAPQRQGQKLSSEILSLFLKHHLLEQTTIRAHIAAGNEASRRCFTSAGFKDNGTTDADGFHIHVFSRTTSE